MTESIKNKPRNVAIQTLGCKLNQAETELMSEEFTRVGYSIVEPESDTDIYILNTCTVTHIADRKARHLLKLARRRHPEAFIVATGCYAQRSPGELDTTGIVDLVIPQSDKVEVVDKIAGHNSFASLSHKSNFYPGRTRSFIKIQDGCRDGCAYCIVPHVRGKETSLSSDDIVSQVNTRVSQGYKEAVLTGTKIGSYHRDSQSLNNLVSRILRETSIERLRLSSLQPHEITPDFLTLWADPRLCRHLHMPLQSGSDEILSRMRRRYSVQDFRNAVKMVRDMIPDMAITTDIIVGFPGESDSDFQNSLDFSQQIGFAAIHVFPYSPRHGTRAADMTPVVDAKNLNMRGQLLRKLAFQSASVYREGFIGTTRSVLWEREVSSGVWSGLTDNYLRVFSVSLSHSPMLANQVSRVRLTGVSGKNLLSEITPQNLIFTKG